MKELRVIMLSLFLSTGSIRARGIELASQETYGNGVRKVIYRDPDDNEIGFGGTQLE